MANNKPGTPPGTRNWVPAKELARWAERPAVARPDLFAPDLSGLPGRRFSDLRANQCRYEISGAKHRWDFRFCGAPVLPLPPYAYCAKHAAIAYKMPEPPKRR